MKKTIISVMVAFAMLFVSLFAAACGGPALSAPEIFDLDDEYRLSWEAVEDANTYVLEIKAVDGAVVNENTRTTGISLSNLEEGDYEIKVKSVGAGFSDSPWSAIIYFHKDYENGCLYELINNNTEYKVSKVNKASGVVDLGDYYRSKPVTAIGERAFRGSSKVTGVVFGRFIEKVENNAFFSCNKLVSVTFSAALKEIGVAAFQSCSVLESVTLPSGVTDIPESAFSYCRSLSSFTAPSVVNIGESSFSGCSLLKTYDMPDSLEYIGPGAFLSSGLTEITIGKSVKTIDENAFYDCKDLQTVEFSSEGNLKTINAGAFAGNTKLASVALPDGLESIGNSCFNGDAALENVSIPDSVISVGLNAFRRTALYNNQVASEEEPTLVYADKWLVAINKAVLGNTVLIGASKITNSQDSETLIMRSDTVGIANEAFKGCKKLEQLRLPHSVKYIGAYAFYKCHNLWEFWATEGSALKILGTGAFMSCERLYNVILNNGLKEIRKQAFYGCSALNNNTQNPNVLTPLSLEAIGTAAFWNTALFNSVEANSVVYAGKWVVGNKLPAGGLNDGDTPSEITLEDDTRGIADYALADTRIKSIINLHRVRFIGNGAFSGCNQLSTVTLSSSVSEIKPYTFYNCSRLFNIGGLPAMLEKIGDCAFFGCTRLSTLDLSQSTQGVKEIGDYAFYGCTNLKNRQSDDGESSGGIVADGIKLGNSLTRIGNSAFYGCTELDEIIIPDSVTSIGRRVFGKCYNLQAVRLGSNVEEIGDYAFMYTALTEVNLPASVKSVGDFAYYKCGNLKSVTLNGVESVGDCAFAGASQLTDVTFSDDIKTIGDQAFRGCVALSCVNLPSSITEVGVHAFYSGTSLTLFAEEGINTDYWSGNWNSLFRPVIRNVELSDEGYVVSLTVTETTFSNAGAIGGVSEPKRRGYNFLGWALSPNGTPLFSAERVVYAPVGITLYSVWQER